MDDQFGGRTDDDLFADEFEPVDEYEVQPESTPPPVATPVVAAVPAPVAAPAPIPAPIPASAPASVDAVAATEPPATTGDLPSTAKVAPTVSDTVVNTAARTETPKSLLQSIHAPPQPPASAPRAPRNHRSNHNNHNNNHNHNKNSSSNSNSNSNININNTNNAATAAAISSPSSPAPSSATKGEGSDRERRPHGAKPHVVAEARLKSGANPRTKLTEEELAEKMAKMKLLNAEKTKQFERANADEQSHAMALEKATEAAKKRRADEAERKRREALDRRQMDDEREQNRARKLKAMGAKEGGWDEGKEERLVEEERMRGGFNFRGANGGVRGPTSRGGGTGLASSRFAATTDDTEFMSGRGGRGRGRGGRGRGGRGGYTPRDENNPGTSPAPSASSPAPKKEAVLKPDDFPALPPSSALTNKNVEAAAKADLASPLSPLGKWDDEMEAQDAKNAAASGTAS